jgi:hypothetical protein
MKNLTDKGSNYMVKKFYVLVWLLLIGSAFATVLRGNFDAISIIAISVGALGLLYAFAMWAVFRNPEGVQQPES